MEGGQDCLEGSGRDERCGAGYGTCGEVEFVLEGGEG